MKTVEEIERRVSRQWVSCSTDGSTNVSNAIMPWEDYEALLDHIDAQASKLKRVTAAAKPFVQQLRGTAIENYKAKQGFDLVLHNDHNRPPNLTGKDFRELADAMEE